MFWYHIYEITWSEVTNLFLCFYRSIVFQLYIYVCDQFLITFVHGLRHGTKLKGEVLFVFVYGYLICPVLFVESKDYPFTTKLSLYLCSKSIVLIYVGFIARLFILFHDSYLSILISVPHSLDSIIIFFKIP